MLSRRRIRVAPASVMVWLLAVALAPLAGANDLHALIVGGGPSPEHNQVAIESNVRYLLRLLPTTSERTVLFASGDRKSANVVYEDKGKSISDSERLLSIVLNGREGAYGAAQKYRPTTIPRLDGACKKSDFTGAFDRICTECATNPQPVLLYFTGHGSPDGRRLENNVFDMWGDTMSVRELAAQLAKLPTGSPTTVVMVQCFSGAFGNLLFQAGDPAGALVDRDIAGFFATVKERMAAGCTPEVDESEYHDFTGYFFAALTGQDRVGRRVTGADYNHDGVVGMDEAFCYTLIHDRSIDVPVCTSDVFLRRFVPTPDEEVFKNSYSSVASWASPAQRAALEELSRSLKLSGDDRAGIAYTRFRGTDPNAPRQNGAAPARREFRLALDEARRSMYARWPDLKDPKSRGFAAARVEALQHIRDQRDDVKLGGLLTATEKLSEAEDAEYQKELAETRVIRFVRLFKSVVLAHTLRQGDDSELKQRFARLLNAEGRPLIAPQQSAKR